MITNLFLELIKKTCLLPDVPLRVFNTFIKVFKYSLKKKEIKIRVLNISESRKLISKYSKLSCFYYEFM